ncbi:MAG: cytochrome ubiquinol oxidase subunit I [Acidimicrobiaceae bacterium]|nr:cytochrome ubiquinol oxidase subunit I [Acidimicrobiaceae bacterium]
MSTLSLARWQFAVTTVFHYLFVPLTIGLGLLVAVLQTASYRTGDAAYERMTRFFGNLFLVNFAIGVVTGIVQEFQFGMDWSKYSVFVGNIFGAPLAIEGLLAFFMESTFLGIWIFGRGRVSKRVHLASIWMASLGTILSAAFIVAANSWMQHPVGYVIDPKTHQAVMNNFWAVMTNSTFIAAYGHVLFSAFLTGGVFLLAVSAWHLRKGHDLEAFSKAAKVAIVVTVVTAIATMFLGDNQAKMEEVQQPMKMAAAEALYNTESGASFSIFTLGNLQDNPILQVRIPHILSVLATNTWNGKVQGINQLQKQAVHQYGAGSYVPMIWVLYWSFRIMVGLGILLFLLGGIGLWLVRKRRLERSPRYLRFATWMVLAPFLANSFGWIFTEVGRQPWVVNGLLTTSKAVTAISPGYVAASLIGFTAVYSLLAVIEIGLMVRLAKVAPAVEVPAEAERDLELVY